MIITEDTFQRNVIKSLLELIRSEWINCAIDITGKKYTVVRKETTVERRHLCISTLNYVLNLKL